MEMGGNCDGWEKSQNIWLTAQANDQSHQTQVFGGPNLQIRQEVETAVKTTIQPLISELVEAVRFQCAQEFTAFIPKMVKAVHGQCAQEFEALVPLMVEEMKKLIPSSGSRSMPHDTVSSTSTPRSMRLKFVGNMPNTLYTFTKMQAAGDPLMVELCDSSGNRVKVGPESSAKVRLVVLNGDIEEDDIADWSKVDFDKNKVQPRKDKGPLLKRKPVVTLSEGVASISDVIIFTDNSSWMRSGTFRLGAELLGGEAAEGVSEIAFKVKERRIIIPYAQRLSLEDNLSRLRNIGDKNAKKLATMQIHTVKDFLQLLHTDAKALQEILHIPESKFSEMIKHAESWPLTKECYNYHDETQGVDLVLDGVFNILSVTFRGHSSQPYEALDDPQKELVNNIRCNAYKRRSQLQKTHISYNQALVPVVPASLPSIECVNMQYTHAVQDLDTDQLDSEFWASLIPLFDETGPHHLEASTSSNSQITGKLKAVCNVTKAAIMFMISVQEQDSGAPRRKKQKKMTLFFKQN